MSYPTLITLPDAVRGDYWPPSPNGDAKISFGPITFLENGESVAPTTTLTRVEARFTKLGQKPFVLDSGNSTTRNATITITSASAWTFEIGTIQTFLKTSGTWKFDLAIYHSGATAPLTAYYANITVTADQ